jgi:hypothetical protein
MHKSCEGRTWLVSNLEKYNNIGRFAHKGMGVMLLMSNVIAMISLATERRKGSCLSYALHRHGHMYLTQPTKTKYQQTEYLQPGNKYLGIV